MDSPAVQVKHHARLLKGYSTVKVNENVILLINSVQVRQTGRLLMSSSTLKMN